MKKIYLYIILLVLGAVMGMLLCKQCSHDVPETIIQRDTLVRVDTVKELYPVSIREEIVDSIFVVVRDTIRLKDTLYLNLPIEKKLYATDEYYAEVSGYRPSLDYIEVYPKTKIITERITPTQKLNTIGIGIEASYLSTFSPIIYCEYGRMLHRNVEFYGQVAYDPQIKVWGAGIGIKAQLEF